MTETENPLPAFNFASHPSTSIFNVPLETYISSQPKRPGYTLIGTGALTFDASSPPRILLVQRAGHDSMPHKWEIPGGGCDPEDPSILYGAARELWEETGLIVANIGPRVGKDHIFSTRSGKVVCKFNFIVEPMMGEAGKLDVKLDWNEHQAFVWASEEEVKAKKAGDVQLVFTGDEAERVVLEAFKIKRQVTTDEKPI